MRGLYRNWQRVKISIRLLTTTFQITDTNRENKKLDTNTHCENERVLLMQKNGVPDDLQETLIWNQRSPEARALEKNSKGKIVLRLNALWKPVIDFPQIGIVGATRLTSTEKSNPEKGIVQGDYEGQYNSKGVTWLTYFTWERAQQEVKKQHLKLFPAREAESKTELFLAQLWATGKEQSQALQTLFWTDFSGYWHTFNKKRTTEGGSIAYLGVSEVNQLGNVCAVEWSRDDANQCRNYQHAPQPFLAFEEC
jgi:hypothetical protein